MRECHMFSNKRKLDDTTTTLSPTQTTKKMDLKESAHPTCNFPSEAPDSVYNRFKQGDLLYGFSDLRVEIGTRLFVKGFRDLFANDYNEEVIDALLAGKTEKEIKQDEKKFPPNKSSHFHFLSKFKNYLLRKPYKLLPSKADDLKTATAIRRACKLLLINREGKRSTHMLTKDVDWKRVCNKKRLNGDQDLSVTYSELRAAFRDHQLYGENPHIFFYDKHHRLMKEPPWKDPDIAPLFAEYEKKSKMKKR